MKLQVITDRNGKNTGVFIPIEDWTLIKTNYPDVETLDEDIPEWQQQLLEKRLEAVDKNPDSIKPIEGLFDELGKE